MSDHQQETTTDNIELGAQGGRAEGEVVFNVMLPPKAQEFGDGDDVSSATEPNDQETLMKIEVNDSLISVTSSKGRNKSESPSSKRSSKRKRKNRRRREKKAAAASSDMMKSEGGDGFPHGIVDDSTGTEAESSHNSEDMKKEEGTETGTESETACNEIDSDQNVSSVCVEPSTPPASVSSIPGEKLSDSIVESECSVNSKKEETESLEKKVENVCIPTHSVETLLQIAKCKILSQILEPLRESEETSMNIGPLELPDETGSQLVVPPSSPSSVHKINTGNSTEMNVISAFRQEILEGSQKSVTRNVHFDERPPEILPVLASSSEEPIFSLKLGDLDTVKTVTESASKKSSSRETIILVDNVSHTESATSSIASETSAASLLKGNGSSSEDVAESNPHYPSREAVEESTEEGNVMGFGEINADAFRETIQIFKVQNPTTTQYIGNEVDSILTKSINKLTALMGESSRDDKTVTTRFGSGENATKDEVEEDETGAVEIPSSIKNEQKSQPNEVNDKGFSQCQGQIPVKDENVFALEDQDVSPRSDLNVLKDETDKEMDSDHLHVSMNTTFIVEKVTDEYEHDHPASPRPLSPVEIIPQAIPDTVSDTESIAAVGYLSIVPEEDEDEEEESSVECVNNNVDENVQKEGSKVLIPTASNSSCSTVIETVASIHWNPDGTPVAVHWRPATTTMSTSETVKDKPLNFVPEPTTTTTLLAFSETESAAEDEITATSAILENIQEVDQMLANILSSASSTKSSVSSPRCQDMKTSVVSSRPSTDATTESGQTESEYEIEIEKKEGTRGKQSVEVFTLHFPSITDAPPSENNLDGASGDQHYIETDSDYQWRPERRHSLQQVIHQKEASLDTASIEVHTGEAITGTKRTRRATLKTEQQPEDTAEDEGNDKDSQGCNCGKLCVIT